MEEIEITRCEPVVLEVGGLSHLIMFEIVTRLKSSPQGLMIDGDIKETIYEMRDF